MKIKAKWVEAGKMLLNSKTGNFTAEDGYIYLVDTSSISISIQLPSPASNLQFIIKDSGFTCSNNNVTLVRSGSEKIENVSANYIINSDGTSKYVISNGIDWFII